MILALMATATSASAAQAPVNEGVAVAEFTIVGHTFRIPKPYLTQQGDPGGDVAGNAQ